MTHKAKTIVGGWVYGFLVGYYSDSSRTDIEKYCIFEGIDGVKPIPILRETICSYVCEDENGEKAFENDIVEFSGERKKLRAVLVKSNNGYDISPNYQDDLLLRLKIVNGKGNFKLIKSSFDV